MVVDLCLGRIKRPRLSIMMKENVPLKDISVNNPQSVGLNNQDRPVEQVNDKLFTVAPMAAVTASFKPPSMSEPGEEREFILKFPQNLVYHKNKSSSRISKGNVKFVLFHPIVEYG